MARDYRAEAADLIGCTRDEVDDDPLWAWVMYHVYQGRGPVTFGFTEDGNIGVWVPDDKMSAGVGDSPAWAVQNAIRREGRAIRAAVASTQAEDKRTEEERILAGEMVDGFRFLGSGRDPTPEEYRKNPLWGSKGESMCRHGRSHPRYCPVCSREAAERIAAPTQSEATEQERQDG